MATINYDYYAGADAYSDGDIENTLLKLVEQGTEFEQLQGEEISYPVLYHLSHLRENIINWYPIEKNQTVLEIGSGCGAITNALCKKAKRVVSVELSKRRALINFTRNKEKSNLEIIVGNLNDIEFEEKFDYVILNGVFEYAMSFFDDEEPYIKLLNLCKNHLNPSGKILIAIENRLGIKYFTGAPEDHTKNYFLGLNEYENNQSVRTFSKTEWKKLLKRCGLGYKFYYPYPDYKFPEEIYTDSSIKSGTYGKPYINYDADRFEWISEQQMTKALVEEGVMTSFSNSLFIEAAMNNSFSDIEYSKMSCDRRRDRRILTVIHNQNGKKWVEKIAADEAAVSHIKKLHVNSCITTKNQKVVCLPGDIIGKKIVYKYLTEKSLEDDVLFALERTGKEEAFRMIKNFFETYFDGYDVQDFVAGEEFQEVFGKYECEKKYSGIAGGNIDIILDNVFPLDNKYCIIDCEWIFDFIIPINFIIWRSVNDFYVKHGREKGFFEKEELFNYLGIEEEDVPLFERWNVYFAYKWLKANTTEKFGKPISYVSMDYMTGLYRRENHLVCSLYYDCGDGYSEENKLFTEVALKGQHFEAHFDLSEIRNIQKLRFDPIEGRACRCRLKGNGLKLLPVNACENEGEWDVFLTDDPMYEVSPEEDEKLYHVVISGEIIVIDFNEWYRKMNNINRKELDESQHENEKLAAEIKGEKEQNEILQRELNNTLNGLQNAQAQLQHTRNLLQLETEKAGNLDAEIQHLNEILDSIYNSRGWKALSFIKGIVKREKNN